MFWYLFPDWTTVDLLESSFSWCPENCSTRTMACLNIRPTTRTRSRSAPCLRLWTTIMSGEPSVQFCLCVRLCVCVPHCLSSLGFASVDGSWAWPWSISTCWTPSSPDPSTRACFACNQTVPSVLPFSSLLMSKAPSVRLPFLLYIVCL